jgi:hypothetical protein
MSDTRKRGRDFNASYNHGNVKKFTGRLGENLPPTLRNPHTGKLHRVLYPPEQIEKLKDMGTSYSAARTVYNPRTGWPRSSVWGVKTNENVKNDPDYVAYFAAKERHLDMPLDERYNRATYSPAASPKRPPGLGGSRSRRSRSKKTRRNRHK